MKKLMMNKEEYLEDLLTLDEVIHMLEIIKSKHGGNIKVADVSYSGTIDSPVVDIDMIEPQVIKTSVTDDELIVVFR
jgi:hypothetical protein